MNDVKLKIQDKGDTLKEDGEILIEEGEILHLEVPIKNNKLNNIQNSHTKVKSLACNKG